MKKAIILTLVFLANNLNSNAQFLNSYDWASFSSWSSFDIDGDTRAWGLIDISTYGTPIDYLGECVYSESESGRFPNNMFISPAINVSTATTNIKLKWDVGSFFPTSTGMHDEHYSVFVSTTNDVTTIYNSTPIFSETLAEGELVYTRLIDISSFLGSGTIYVAILHHNTTDNYSILIDNVSVFEESVSTNTPPVAIADVSTTNQDTPVSTDVLANDSDPGGSLVPSSVTVTVPSSNGTTVVNTSTGAITFTPSAGFTGTTTYTYQVCDDGSPALCASAVVTITVNAVTSTISADDDTGTCIENDIDASIDILAGDFLNGQAATRFNVDVDVDLATAGIQNTFVSASPSATWTFDNVSFGMLGCNPGLDVEGTLTLSYVICDKANPTVCSNTATVTLTVTPSTVSLTENTLVFALFPNPATDMLTIHANSSAKSIKIISLEGKELINEVLVDANIAVASLANGLYQIEVRFEDGRVGRSSFMKN